MVSERRELILERVETVLRAIAPGVSFPGPRGIGLHDPIVTDLGGRVYGKLVNLEELDEAAMPFVCTSTEPGHADVMTERGISLYSETLNILLLGFVRDEDGGSPTSSTLARPGLAALARDLTTALKGLPYYTDADHPTPLLETAGHLAVVVSSREIDTPDGIAWGSLAMRASIGYDQTTDQ